MDRGGASRCNRHEFEWVLDIPFSRVTSFGISEKVVEVTEVSLPLCWESSDLVVTRGCCPRVSSRHYGNYRRQSPSLCLPCVSVA